jgi:hypothetical protein
MLGHPFRCPRNYIILSINQLQICVKKNVKVRITPTISESVEWVVLYLNDTWTV